MLMFLPVHPRPGRWPPTACASSSTLHASRLLGHESALCKTYSTGCASPRIRNHLIGASARGDGPTGRRSAGWRTARQQLQRTRRRQPRCRKRRPRALACGRGITAAAAAACKLGGSVAARDCSSGACQRMRRERCGAVRKRCGRSAAAAAAAALVPATLMPLPGRQKHTIRACTQ